MFAGFSTTARSSRTETYSAKAPPFPPKTSSPGRNSVTFVPTASTVPAKSTPDLSLFGLRSPIWMRATYGVPVRSYQSAGFTEAARTRTSTSSSVTSGLSI